MFPIKYSWNFVKFDMLHMELNFKTARVRYNDIKYFLKESINHWNGIEIYYRFILSFFDHFPLKYFSNFSFWSLSFFSFMSFSFDFFKNFISWAFSFWSFSYQGHFHGHRIYFYRIYIFWSVGGCPIFFPRKKYYCLWKQRVFKRERIVLKL